MHRMPGRVGPASVIETTDLDTGNKRQLGCPTCHASLSIDPDAGDIGYLRCDADDKHLWRLHTALERQRPVRK